MFYFCSLLLPADNPGMTKNGTNKNVPWLAWLPGRAWCATKN